MFLYFNGFRRLFCSTLSVLFNASVFVICVLNDYLCNCLYVCTAEL